MIIDESYLDQQKSGVLPAEESCFITKSADMESLTQNT